jgi:hydrogenase maturation protease
MRPAPSLVIGYGNELRGDDGIGQVVVRALHWQQQEAAELGDASFIWSPQLVPEIAMDLSRAGFAVFVDAAQNGQVPGSVSLHRLSDEDAAQQSVDRGTVAVGCWVDLSPVALVLLSADLYGWAPPAAVVTVSVGETSIGLGLSPRVRAAVPVAAQAVRDAISSWRSQPGHLAGHSLSGQSLSGQRLPQHGMTPDRVARDRGRLLHA